MIQQTSWLSLQKPFPVLKFHKAPKKVRIHR